ncbi:MAG: short-chain dehydrogenase [Betaproteobacteria bacterium RIFCSPLOWO2_12_FULL_65_14]|nr:MAG: short-chain dehydrogenase [Betaproteobacteria bacterium RIFCSPLOWO2_12_FULL_65_14]
MITALVTGANKGIGLEFCRQLAARGDKVLAACRRTSPELRALPARVLEGIEMTSDEAIGRLARELAGTRLDWLVLNAGVFDSGGLGELDFGRMRHEYDVDALGPLRVTQALLPNLPSGARIAIVSSRAGSIGDNTSGGNYGYCMAKAALNMAGVSLARDLASRGVAVVMLHPGVVDTDLFRAGRRALGRLVQSADTVTPQVAVRDMLPRIDELTLEASGRFLHRNGSVLPW